MLARKGRGEEVAGEKGRREGESEKDNQAEKGVEEERMKWKMEDGESIRKR